MTNNLNCVQVPSAAAAAAAKSLQSCPTLCDPIDGSPPGFTVPGILQARTLEWAVISFSSAWKWKGKVKSLSRVQLFATPWTAAHQAPLHMGFSRQEYCWSGVPLPSPKCLLCHIAQGSPSSPESNAWDLNLCRKLQEENQSKVLGRILVLDPLIHPHRVEERAREKGLAYAKFSLLHTHHIQVLHKRKPPESSLMMLALPPRMFEILSFKTAHNYQITWLLLQRKNNCSRIQWPCFLGSSKGISKFRIN